MAKRIKSNSDYTDHPSVYQSMLISFTSLLLRGISNEKQRRVNLAMTEKRRIAAVRELCRTRDASSQAFSMRLGDSTVALPRRWDCVSTDTSASRNPRTGAGSRIKVPYPIPRDVTPLCKRWGGSTRKLSDAGDNLRYSVWTTDRKRRNWEGRASDRVYL